MWKVISNPNTPLSQMIVQKYRKGNIENIGHKHSNGCWRWKDIQKQIGLIMNNLFWDLRSKEHVPVKSHFWWNVVRSVLQGLQTISQFRNNEGF